ncbi:hypothetical protein [Pseudomonas oligotrophica]|uniref:hypothetical protein n=1 Tax=Pseudomonas oligotrophica TaxID=2912055 RepID=UPI001F420778|nr:hypothetical protein [Pseudomonas oligotrophica]MCF7202912.1 hypothetical protein [Pseudomonas oligotrophica]
MTNATHGLPAAHGAPRENGPGDPIFGASATPRIQRWPATRAFQPLLSLGVIGAVLDYRAAERDRTARSVDYNNPATL